LTDVNTLQEQKVELFGASVGVGDDAMNWVGAFSFNEVPVLCVDVAHGHHDMVVDLLKRITKEKKDKFREIIAGNVCTAEAALDLGKAGATIVKVGVGPGSHCTTRLVTGHGVPQLSAIAECVMALNAEPGLEHVEVIADGGLRSSGDMAKAFAAGASYVMSGRLFAGCDETPTAYETIDGRRCKVYRGSASYEVQTARGDKTSIIVEGVATRVAANGPTASVMEELAGGLKSAFSYCGVDNMIDFQDHAQFIHVTGNGLQEAKSEV
jgi:IMP dehydrogenase